MNRLCLVLLALAHAVAPASLASSLTVPIVLTSTGIAGSFYTSELTLTNRGTGTVTLGLTYSAAFGGGSGAATDTLSPGRQQIVPNAIDYLIGRGVPIPREGNRGGTLRIDFSGPSTNVGATVRTTTAVEGGRAGLCYSGIAGGLSEPAYLCGLRQSGNDRSNVAVLNAGGPGEGSIALRLTVFSHEPGAPPSQALPDVTLSPGEFKQFTEVLAGLGLKSGHIRVERVSGAAPYFCYATVMNQETSDGSFVEPIGESALAGSAGLTLPVVVESPAYSTELVLTNLSTSFKPLNLLFVASAIQAPDSTAAITVVLDPGEQRTIPSLVQLLRDRGAPGVGSAGPTFAGALFVTSADGPTVSGVAVGARTSTPAGTGRYGLFYGAVPYGGAATASAWLYGLQQDAENRANLAVVNTGEVDASTDVFSVDLFDGGTGAKASSFTITLEARKWTQVNGVLAQYAPGVKNGYARVTRVSGSNPFLAYGVLNDGGKPGERSGDGAFLRAALDSAGTTPTPTCTYGVSPTSQTFTASAGTGSVTVTAQSGCPWTAASDSTWLTITSGSSGTGNGTVAYAVSANTGSARTGKLTVAGQTVTVSQSAAGGTLPESSSWLRLGGPPGGLGYDIRMRPDNPDVMFVTDGYAGIHRSTDGGKSWTAVNKGMEACTWCGASVFCATIDPHDHDTIWTGTQFTGHIYRSTDNGDSWEQRDTGLTFSDEQRSLRGLTVDPKDPNTVYAGLEVRLTQWSDGTPTTTPRGRWGFPGAGEVYKSTDAGAHWTRIWKGESLARYIWVDPRNTKRVYVSTGIFDRDASNSDIPNGVDGGVGILRSDDGGQTWTVLDERQGLGGRYIPSLFMHPTNPDVLIAAVTLPSQAGGVYVTRNGGDTWSKVLAAPPNNGIEAVEISTKDTNVWYAGYEGFIYRSDDAGVTWQSFAVGSPDRPKSGVPIDLQADPRNALRIFVNNYGGGNFVSEDGGATWSDASKGYTGAPVSVLAVEPGDGKTVWAGPKSTDGGATWRSSTAPPYASMVLRKATDGVLHLWVGDGNGKVHRSTDGGSTWQAAVVAADSPPATTQALAVAPSDARVVYSAFGTGNCLTAFNACYVSQKGMHRSTDGGASWQLLTGATFADVSVMSFAIHPTDARTVYASGGRSLHRSSDGGATWQDFPAFETEVARYVTNNDIYQIEQGGKPITLDVVLDPFDPKIVYTACLPGVLMRSTDAGVTWRQIAAGMDANEPVVDLLVDPRHEGVIYAASMLSGVFVSKDRGLSWRKLDQTFAVPTPAVLALSENGDVLYAGSAVNTRGAGVFRLGTP